MCDSEELKSVLRASLSPRAVDEGVARSLDHAHHRTVGRTGQEWYSEELFEATGVKASYLRWADACQSVENGLGFWQKPCGLDSVCVLTYGHQGRCLTVTTEHSCHMYESLELFDAAPPRSAMGVVKHYVRKGLGL